MKQKDEFGFCLKRCRINKKIINCSLGEAVSETEILIIPRFRFRSTQAKNQLTGISNSTQTGA